MNKKRIFITGIPTAGKSYLGKKIVEKIGGVCISLDDIRENLARDEKYKKWVNFYIDLDERTYYTTTTHDEQWSNLVRQSEGLWAAVLEKISQYDNDEQPVIFEGVNILPHLVHRDLSLRGIVLIGRTFEETLERNKKDSRWGMTEEFQTLEADAFWNGERPHYKEEGEKYGHPVFETPDQAINTAIEFLTI